MSVGSLARTRDIRLGPREVSVERFANGAIYVHATNPLGSYPERMTELLDHWAVHTPERTYIAQRREDRQWRAITYSHARDMARRIGQSLLKRGLSAERPIAILSGNDLEHAMLALGAMYAGIPFCPLSTAYSLVSKDFQKLRGIFELLTPGLVFAAAGRPFARALEAVMPPDAELVVARDPLPGATMFDDLLSATPGSELDAAQRRIGPDSVFKILFTSGSVARPKGVMTTQRMWTSNQEMVRTCWPFVAAEPPVILEWMPWSHAAAGNKDMGLILYNGGSLYLDEGKPIPGQFDETIRNLREIAPTIFLNVPIAFELLLPWLRRDRALAENFFSRLQAMFYAGAGLSQHTWEEYASLSREITGERVLMLTALGSTETAPFAMWAGKEASRADEVGIPAPGMTLKLAPVEGKWEARFRGPNITPGYWRQADLTRAAFDEEGFYRMGDALRFVDPADGARGFYFDGRVVEDFKLSTGTWVSVGPLRGAFLTHFAPYARDVAIAGRDRHCLTALVFPALDPCRALCPDLGLGAEASSIVSHPAVREKFRERLVAMAAQSTGHSNRFARLLLLDSPPSLDAHELTDKGSISQRAVLENRAADVEEMYAAVPSSRIICVDE